METAAHKKYARIIDALDEIARCTEGKVMLVGGTALAIFYLKHRVSVDLDFVPLEENETKAKERMKGNLSKAGYATLRARFSNQFVLQFNDTSVKVEFFIPERKLSPPFLASTGSENIKIATLEDLFEMKKDAYLERGKARDIYDIIAILRKWNRSYEEAIELIKKRGIPEDLEELKGMVTDNGCYADFEKVLKDAA